MYEGRLQSSWTDLITPSRNFVEVRWRSLFRSTSLGKRCTSYNAPPTSAKRATDRWSLRNFLPQSSLFMVGKGYKSHGARSGLYGGCSNGVPTIHFFQAEHRIQFRLMLLTEHHAMKAYQWSGDIASRLLDLGTKWRWAVSYMTRPLYPQGKSPWYPLDRRLAGPQSRVVKKKIPSHAGTRTPDHRAHSLTLYFY
jgi:hypothetical protein